MVAHAFNPSTWEAEAGGFLSSRPAWSTEWVPGQPGLHRETLYGKKTKPNQPTKQTTFRGIFYYHNWDSASARFWKFFLGPRPVLRNNFLAFFPNSRIPIHLETFPPTECCRDLLEMALGFWCLFSHSITSLSTLCRSHVHVCRAPVSDCSRHTYISVLWV